MTRIGQGLGEDHLPLIESLFTSRELAACNLRALFAAYQGHFNWPRVPLPLDLRDAATVVALHHEAAAAQLAFDFA